MNSLPVDGTLRIGAPDWAQGDRPGEWVRTLINDPRGYRTLMLKIPPCPLGALHAHDEIEQIHVLEGDFFDDEASYGSGDFLVRMPGTMHRAGSHGGCTMLLVYAPMIEDPI